jgi:hypothetical protein
MGLRSFPDGEWGFHTASLEADGRHGCVPITITITITISSPSCRARRGWLRHDAKTDSMPRGLFIPF